jgi:hypothetical protein
VHRDLGIASQASGICTLLETHCLKQHATKHYHEHLADIINLLAHGTNQYHIQSSGF